MAMNKKEIMEAIKSLASCQGSYARQAIIIKVAEMVGASDTVIDTWHTYDTKKGELPSILDRTVARHIAMDLIFE